MSRSRAATPAGKRRAKPAPKGGTRASHPRRPKPARKPPARRAPTRKATARKPPARKPPARKRSTKPRRPPRRSSAKPRGGLSWTGRLLIATTLLAALTAGYFLWLRDSSLVAVTDVEVAGLTTSQRGAIESELTKLSEEMTTLNFDEGRIEDAALAYTTVASVDVDPNFPHGARIEIDERPPRMIVSANGAEMPVAEDGTLLEGVEADPDALPAFEVDELPPGGTLEDTALEQALATGAAPPELRPLIDKVGHSSEYGVEFELEGGVELRFGDGTRASEKWAAAAAVLANADTPTLDYVDVRIPQRPATNGADSAPDAGLDANPPA